MRVDPNSLTDKLCSDDMNHCISHSDEICEEPWNKRPEIEMSIADIDPPNATRLFKEDAKNDITVSSILAGVLLGATCAFIPGFIITGYKELFSEEKQL